MATAFQENAFQENVFQIDLLVGAVFPDPSQVFDGVTYGPTGADFVGTMKVIYALDTDQFVILLSPNRGITL
jgi:hypothetical protein